MASVNARWSALKSTCEGRDGSITGSWVAVIAASELRQSQLAWEGEPGFAILRQWCGLTPGHPADQERMSRLLILDAPVIMSPTGTVSKPEESVMPSIALQQWRNDRLPCLTEIDAQLAACQALAPPNPRLSEENLRGYIVLLSAHFQGFCRDLYTECAQIVVTRVRLSLQALIQAQFLANHAIDHGNPNLQNLKKDFERFGFTLDLAAADPGNPARLQDLSELNRWRNIVAHYGVILPSGLPLPSELQRWTSSCDRLATSLDRIMYNRLRHLLRRAPWTP
jgi:hypothetical protein